MFESFLITFRESLEAALIIGIILAFLKRNGKQSYYFLVMTAIGAGLAASLLGGTIFSMLENGFTGRTEQIFEGSTMMLACILLTYMILWLYQQKNPKHHLEQKLMTHAEEVKKMNLFFLVFFAIFREGIETVLFLNAAFFQSGANAISGGFAGVFCAILIGYLIFVLEVKLPIKRFFQVSGALLIFFAAGLLVNGISEFHEAGLIPTVVEHIYNLNPLLSEKEGVGLLLQGLIGYKASPSLIELVAYFCYLGGAFFLFFRSKKHLSSDSPGK